MTFLCPSRQPVPGWGETPGFRSPDRAVPGPSPSPCLGSGAFILSPGTPGRLVGWAITQMRSKGPTWGCSSEMSASLGCPRLPPTHHMATPRHTPRRGLFFTLRKCASRHTPLPDRSQSNPHWPQHTTWGEVERACSSSRVPANKV